MPAHVLFLDDMPERQEKFRARFDMRDKQIVFAANYAQAIVALPMLVFDEAWLDHDLGEYATENGYDVAVFIAAMPADKRPREIIVHTMNPVGRERMIAVLRDAGFAVSTCFV